MATIVLAGGSADRGATRYAAAARAFGRGVAEAGWVLRTGGGSGASVMGAAADGALGAGGRVEGVILKKFWKVRHRGLHSMHAYETFALRKAGLFHKGDAAVVFPGGYGTLDELSDLVVLRQTGFTRMPVLLVNLFGFYDALLKWEGHADREGFLYGRKLFRVTRTVTSTLAALGRFLR
jgi:hypothetical protein